MSRYDYSPEERELNAVLAAQDATLASFEPIDGRRLDEEISRAETLLSSLGYALPEKTEVLRNDGNAVMIPSWEEVRDKAVTQMGLDVELESLFTSEELATNSLAVRVLNEEYNQVHRLDEVDVAICAFAGILAGAVDIALTGIPEPTSEGLQAGPMSDWIRGKFKEWLPEKEMEKLARGKGAKVPYDASINKGFTNENVEGLTPYMHRLYSLGHYPLLGLIVGVKDILSGEMTTIDKMGNVVVQQIERYADRRESAIFAALAKQILHMKTDVNTPMGLPAPLMGLFNLAQFGSIGEQEQTVAEIVQSMYYEGYDFVHFCSMSISQMLVEVIVRLGYTLKRVKEGHPLEESVPMTTNHTKHPKVGTMLFVANSAATAINAGKIYFSGCNPMAINYPQWVAFAKYSLQQAKWVVLDKPEARHGYVMDEIDKELDVVYGRVNDSFLRLSDGAIMV